MLSYEPMLKGRWEAFGRQVTPFIRLTRDGTQGKHLKYQTQEVEELTGFRKLAGAAGRIWWAAGWYDRPKAGQYGMGNTSFTLAKWGVLLLPPVRSTW